MLAWFSSDNIYFCSKSNSEIFQNLLLLLFPQSSKERKSGVKQKVKQTMSVMNSRLLFLLNYFQFFILLTLAVKRQGFEISLSLI
jgi:hypothetical protein